MRDRGGARRSAQNTEDEGRRGGAYNKEQVAAKRQDARRGAQGKSDAEVDKSYAAKIKSDSDAANRALSSGQGAAALKQSTGKSMQEIQQWSPAELEAIGKELEKKYGK